MDDKSNPSDLKKELLISFNQQFAENQNQHQQAFIQVLSVLLTVLIGYGYVFTNGGKLDSETIVVKDFLLEIAFVIAITINGFGILLILNNAHGFRRDQFVVSKIRQQAGLISTGGGDTNLYIFPPTYDPKESYILKNKEWLKFKQKNRITRWAQPFKWLHYSVSWMPNFYNILLLTLAIIHASILASFILNPYDTFTLTFNYALNLHWYHLVAVLYWVMTTVYLINRVTYFRKRLEITYGL